MADICLSGAVLAKAGKHHSLSGAAFIDTLFIPQAISYISTVSRINFSGAYAAFDADVKRILEDAISSKAAISVINYDMSGYTSRAEAQTMLDVNYTIMTDAIKLLKDKEYTDFIEGE